MRRSVIALLIGFIFAMASVIAHPVEDLVLKYDKETSLLSIRIVHESKDFNKHFIEKIWVSVDKKKVVTQKFTSQDDLDGLSLQYKLFNLKKGDEIQVDAKCNIYGEKSATLEIE